MVSSLRIRGYSSLTRNNGEMNNNISNKKRKMEISKRGQQPDRYVGFFLYNEPVNSKYDNMEEELFLQRTTIEQQIRIGMNAKNVSYIEGGYPINNDEMTCTPQLLFRCYDTVTKNTIELTDSYTVLQFLDHIYPEVSITRNDCPTLTSYCMEIVQTVRSYDSRLRTLDPTNYETEEEAVKLTRKCLVVLEKLVCTARSHSYHTYHGSIGPYCLGTFTPTMADIYVATEIQMVRTRTWYPNTILDTKCQLIVHISNLCYEHPWFQQQQQQQEVDYLNRNDREDEDMSDCSRL